MRIRKVITAIFLLVFSISLIACFLAGCDFVSYVEKSENQIVSDEVKALQEEYVEKLSAVTSGIKYRDKEQKLFEYAMQDAVNELYECRSETELIQVYDKHLLAIGKIKTDEEYTAEEEADAVNVYRAAILRQAQESYDSQKYTEEQNKYFDSVFTAFSNELSETADREKMNELLQTFYFDVHKEDEILSLINYADVSSYEDSQQTILNDTLENCIKEIRGSVKQEVIDGFKEVYIFEVYKRDTVKKLKEYVDLRLYREEQVTAITEILTEHLILAEQAQTNIEADNVFREYQIAVYEIPTDEMLYFSELSELKEELYGLLDNTYKLSFYRESEGQTIHELLSSFRDLLGTLQKKEDVLAQYVVFESRLDSVKTAKELDEEERLSLIEELFVQIQDAIDENIEEADKDTYLAKAELVYAEMKDRVSLDGIRQEYRKFIQEIAGTTIGYLKEELIEFNNSVIYRENEQNLVNAIKEEYLDKFSDGLGIEEAKALLQEAKDAINEVKTNDDWWDESLTKFRADLKALYGDAVLEEPRSLTEANDYFELADIIDYYAFYQLSGTEFLCGTFRVKLNFEHKNAVWERNEVYWYCKLLKSAVDIKTEFEYNSDYLVCTLIPYNFASISNRDETEKIVRNESLVEFDSDKTNFVDRAENFNDFPYYKFNKSATVWNSQQLWYALENGYVPKCVAGSAAEDMLNKAKTILREIIKEGMSDEEKIFNIFKWFAENVQFDNLHQNYNSSSDINNLPNERISALQSHFIEGVLNDRLAVCIGYAKTYLLMLRMEGIAAKLNIARMPYLESNNTIASIANGFHAYVNINLNGVWYYCDCEKSFTGNDESLISYAYICLPKNNSGLYEVMNKDLDAATDTEYYKKLCFKNKKLYVSNKEELIAVAAEFNNSERDGILSVFYNYFEYKDCWIDLVNYDESYEVFKVTRYDDVSELIITKG